MISLRSHNPALSALKDALLLHKTTLVLACIAAATILVVCNRVNNDGLVAASWKLKRIKNIAHDVDNCYYQKLKDDSLSATKRPSIALVLEDGKPLGPGNAPLADIRSKGKGLYTFWNGYVLFSSSDGSDPATNGRKYRIKSPRQFSWKQNTLLFALLFILNSLVLVGIERSFPKTTTERIGRFVACHQSATILAASFAIIIVSNIITKLPYYTYYPMAFVEPDSGGYMTIAHQIATGVFPDLHYRTIGYPLLILLATSVSDTFFSIITFQIVISIAAALTLIYALHQRSQWLSLIGAIALATSAAGDLQLISDVSVLTESLYTSCLIFSLAFLALALQKKRNVYFLACSFFVGYSMYVRPTGYFLLPILILTLIFLWHNRFSVGNMLSLMIPCITMFMAVMFYNQVTYGKFTFTDGGAYTFTITAGSFLEQDPAYPKEWNAAIAEVQSLIDPKDLDTILSSWDMYPFYASYYKYFECAPIWNRLSKVSPNLVQRNSIFTKIAMDAVRKHIGVYLKIIFFNARILFTRGIEQQLDYFERLHAVSAFILGDAVEALPVDRQKIYLKEYFELKALPHSKVVIDPIAKHVNMKPSFIRSVCSLVTDIQGRFFQNSFWVYVPFFTLFLSLFNILRTKFSDAESFYMLVLILFYFGNPLLCSLFSFDLRFISVVVFANHLSAFLLLFSFAKYCFRVFSEVRENHCGLAIESNSGV